jgi:hypothetical protein
LIIDNVIDLNNKLSISTNDAFERAALELFDFQVRHCAPYREYVAMLGTDPAAVRRWADIPHLPIEVFRSRAVYCGEDEPEKIFTSSSTGGDAPSRHFVGALADYEACFRMAFSVFYGAPSEWSFYCLLPGYLEREGSSLVYMAADLIEQGGGGFYLNDYETMLARMEADSKPKILLGVSYALWDLAERHPRRLRDTIVVETGGMKGRREELPKEEFHAILCRAFGVGEIHSEYGMAELSSQAYSAGKGLFRTPPWMRVRTRDLNDSSQMLPAGRSGGIDITDLANIRSCAFIQTQDMGRTHPDNSFTISGRIDHSQIRGCNLMVE